MFSNELGPFLKKHKMEFTQVECDSFILKFKEIIRGEIPFSRPMGLRVKMKLIKMFIS